MVSILTPPIKQAKLRQVASLLLNGPHPRSFTTRTQRVPQTYAHKEKGWFDKRGRGNGRNAGVDLTAQWLLKPSRSSSESIVALANSLIRLRSLRLNARCVCWSACTTALLALDPFYAAVVFGCISYVSGDQRSADVPTKLINKYEVIPSQCIIARVLLLLWWLLCRCFLQTSSWCKAGKRSCNSALFKWVTSLLTAADLLISWL